MSNGELQPDQFTRRPKWEEELFTVQANIEPSHHALVDRIPRISKAVGVVFGITAMASLLHGTDWLQVTFQDTDSRGVVGGIGCVAHATTGMFYRESGILAISTEGTVSLLPGVVCEMQSATQLGRLIDYNTEACTAIGAPDAQGQLAVSAASRERNILSKLTDGAFGSRLQVRNGQVLYCGNDDRLLMPRS